MKSITSALKTKESITSLLHMNETLHQCYILKPKVYKKKILLNIEKMYYISVIQMNKRVTDKQK